MASGTRIQPDTRFIRDVITSGGGDLKKCMQCATCTAVCELASDETPFPRKQILEAQWGLKDRLMGDPALWLCHNCGDCTSHCPRGARPGDIFNALRRQAIRNFAVPSFLGAAVNRPAALAVLLLVPVLLFAAIALSSPAAANDGPLEFANVFPVPVMETVFFVISGLAALGFALGIARFVRALRVSGADAPILAGLGPALAEIAVHRRFRKCTAERGRSVGHLLTLWGFMGLAVVGTAAGVGAMTGLMHTPMALTNPWKILANASAITLLAGTLLLLAGRLGDREKRAASSYFDWFFLLMLFGVVLTGVASEGLRLAQAAQAMYAVYFVHLVLIFSLILYAPYSKFAHLAYRTVAMAAAGVGRKKPQSSLRTT